MAAPFRIEQHPVLGADDGFREYLERLLKMIPAEIVGLYTIGAGLIPSDAVIGSVIWTGVCLVLLIIVRVYGTGDPKEGKPPQPVPVGIAAIAFLIWMYSIGGPFAKLGIDVPWIGSLGVLVWSFVIPIFYKGSPP
jgi:hypothetical protein